MSIETVLEWSCEGYGKKGEHWLWYGKKEVNGVNVMEYVWNTRGWGGEAPPRVIFIRKCGVSRCINPEHLRLMDLEEAQKKNRWVGKAGRDKIDFRSQLMAEDVLAIRRSNKTVNELAQDYGVTGITIRNILKGHTWAWVKDERDV